MKKKVELLAPAGNVESMTGAFAAGADAVYFGGERFGARAYADNFTTAEAVRAIRYAHLLGRKMYLTVNTLVKETELEALEEYLAPYADAGVDGVIVQDFGVMSGIRRCFPKLRIHASTQMTVTGVYGARMLKGMGAARVVPARELSLPELAAIRREADIEVEAFIHGAMCYSYSGVCLFSAMLGERSGNRGRCAQACRLPYVYEGTWTDGGYAPGGRATEGNAASGRYREQDGAYLLSLKDMCTVAYLPQLIAAGVDSFKIEGRMKKPAYAAGVTAVYRKYIDRFFEAPEAPFHVDSADMALLRALYLRTGISAGYLDRHGGAEMVTIARPGYGGTDEAVLETLKESYLTERLRLPVRLHCRLRAGEAAALTITCAEGTATTASVPANGTKAVFVSVPADGEKAATASVPEDGTKAASVTVCGEVVQRAQSRPLTEAAVRRQLERLGESDFRLTDLTVDMEDGSAGGVFLPVQALNRLRREACAQLTERILERYERNR